MAIQIDELYREVSTGCDCYVVAFVRLRHPDTGAWLDGVEYYSLEDEGQTLYVRTVESFEAAFVKVVS